MSDLPIMSQRRELLETIHRHRVVVVQGATGCGKSTKLPTFLFENSKGEASIICTQPRRVACVNVAARVAWELGRFPGVVGHHIGMEVKAGPDNKILFVTNGIMLNYLLHNPQRLRNLDYLILDEVHERDLDLDLILLLVKVLLPVFPRFRLVLMSATLDATIVSRYFAPAELDLDRMLERACAKPSNSTFGVKRETPNSVLFRPNPDKIEAPNVKQEPGVSSEGCAPMVVLQAKSPFPVSSFCIDELQHFFGFVSERANKYSTYSINASVAMLIDEFIECSFELIDFILREEETRIKGVKQGQFLIFLPGLAEIYYFMHRFTSCNFLQSVSYEVHIMHSTVPEPILNNLSKNMRHFILATNIAESSITIPGLSYIIDFCLVKEQVIKKQRVSSLELCWASKASCQQRKGRTGRVGPGFCFFMIPRRFFESLPIYSTAEISRLPLDRLVLRTNLMLSSISLGEDRSRHLSEIFKSPVRALRLAVDPPSDAQVLDAVNYLVSVKAVYMEQECMKNTFFGNCLNDLPIADSLVKLILFGRSLGVADSATTVAAIFSARKPFLKDANKLGREELIEYFKMMYENSLDQECDVILLLKLYSDWEERFAAGESARGLRFKLKKFNPELKEFLSERFLDLNSLLEVYELKTDLYRRLVKYPFSSSPVVSLEKSDPDFFMRLKLSFLSSFFPIVITGKPRYLCEAKKDRLYIETHLKYNSYNSLRVSNGRLKRFLEENECQKMSQEALEGVYVQTVLAELRRLVGVDVKSYRLCAQDLYVEFDDASAPKAIKKLMYITGFRKREGLSTKVFSFERGNALEVINSDDEEEFKFKEKKEEWKSEKHDIDAEAQTLVQVYMKTNYSHELGFEDPLERREISLESSSINKHSHISNDKDKVSFVAFNVRESSSKRYFVRGVSKMSVNEPFFEAALLLLSDEAGWKFHKSGSIEAINYFGLDYRFSFWFDEEDIVVIQRVKRVLESSLSEGVDAPVADLPGQMHSILEARRRRFFFNEKWLEPYMSLQKVEVTGIRLGRGAQTSSVPSTVLYEGYVGWKRGIIDNITSLKAMASIKSGRLVCGDCGQRLVDARSITDVLLSDLLREVGDVNSFFNFLQKVDVESPLNPAQKASLDKHAKDLSLLREIQDYKAYHFCREGHIMAVELSSKPGSMFFLNFSNAWILLPNGTKIQYENLNFRAEEFREKEKSALSERAEAFKGFSCLICAYQPTQTEDAVINHLCGRAHAENEEEFKLII